MKHMKRLADSFTRWSKKTFWEEKVGFVIATLLAISLMIILVKFFDSVFAILGLSILILVLYPIAVVYCVTLVLLLETLIQLVINKLKFTPKK